MPSIIQIKEPWGCKALERLRRRALHAAQLPSLKSPQFTSYQHSIVVIVWHDVDFGERERGKAEKNYPPPPQKKIKTFIRTDNTTQTTPTSTVPCLTNVIRSNIERSQAIDHFSNFSMNFLINWMSVSDSCAIHQRQNGGGGSSRSWKLRKLDSHQRDMRWRFEKW